MKHFLYNLLALCALLGTSTFTFASTPIEVPVEVSALLQEASYQQILNQKSQEAYQTGRTLYITDFNVVEIPPEKYVYVMLATSLSADVTHKLTPAGSIVGSVLYGPQGEVGFDGIYFKPAEGGPGGASVGNQ